MTGELKETKAEAAVERERDKTLKAIEKLTKTAEATELESE